MTKPTNNEPAAGTTDELPNGDIKSRKSQVRQSDVPRYSLHDAMRVAQTISDNYAKRPTKPLNVAIAMNLSPKSSKFRMLVGASSAYGLTEGAHSSDEISITDLGRRIVAPTAEGVDTAAMCEALLRPRVIREFLTKYDGSKLPNERIARNVLEEMGVPADATEQTYQLISSGANEIGLLRDHKGQLYVDLNSTVDDDDDDEPDTTHAPAVDDLPPLRRDDNAGQTTPLLSSPGPQSKNRVFITHGRNLDIVGQLKELLTFGSFVPVVAAEHETVSKPVPDKVMDDMRSCYAAIIHVGKEIKALDQDGKEQVFLNQNVLIEIGAAMALYGRRFILLVERGATLPSNLQGLYEVRYEGDKLDYDATMKLLKAFNEFKS